MIKTITELTKNVWEPVTSINTIKSKIPSTGDVLWVPGVPFGQRTLQSGVSPTHFLVGSEPSGGC